MGALSNHAGLTSRLRAAGCVFAEEEARLLLSAAGTPAELERLVEGRIAGEPLEQVLGWVEFCGLRIAVEPGVFVPRRRTQLLVECAARSVAGLDRPPVVVDLCCGTGAIGVALAARLSAIELYAADLDPAAVRCARRNLAGVGQVFEGDLYAALPDTLRGRVDVLGVNAPYVPTEAIGFMPPEARLHEPALALDGGADGLDIHRRVAGEANDWLAPAGSMLIEVGEDQVPAALGLLARAGLETRVETSEDLDATVVIGSRPDSTRP
jgi:release factor glutamine methyltransferase